VEQVVYHPRDDHGRLRLPVEAGYGGIAAAGPLEPARRALLRRGVPAHLVDGIAAAAVEAANARARGQRKRRR
jgi:hypothetical protein